jgi:hypothetical protein
MPQRCRSRIGTAPSSTNAWRNTMPLHMRESLGPRFATSYCENWLSGNAAEISRWPKSLSVQGRRRTFERPRCGTRVDGRDWEASSRCGLIPFWNASRRIRFSFRRLEAVSGEHFFGDFPTRFILLLQPPRLLLRFCISAAILPYGNSGSRSTNANHRLEESLCALSLGVRR